LKKKKGRATYNRKKKNPEPGKKKTAKPLPQTRLLLTTRPQKKEKKKMNITRAGRKRKGEKAVRQIKGKKNGHRPTSD